MAGAADRSRGRYAALGPVSRPVGSSGNFAHTRLGGTLAVVRTMSHDAIDANENHNTTKLPRLLPRLKKPPPGGSRASTGFCIAAPPELAALRRVQLVRFTNLAAHLIDIRRC